MLAGTGTYAVSQWIIAVVLARMGGPEAIGLFALASALSMPIVVASQLALRQVLVADVTRRYAFSDYFRLRVLATLAAFVAIALLAVVLGYRDETLIAVVGVAGGRCFESVSDIHYGRMQRDERLHRVAQFTMIRGLLCVVAVTAAYAMTESVAAAGLAFAAACAMSAFVVDSHDVSAATSDHEEPLAARCQRAASLVVLSTPLAASQVLNNINVNAPRYILGLAGGVFFVGQLAILEYFVAAASLLVMSLGQSVTPRLAQHYAREELRAFRWLSAKFIGISAGIGALGFVVALLAGDSIVFIMYGPHFEVASQSFAWIMFAAMFLFVTSALGYVVPATGKFDGLVWRQAIVAALSITISTLLAESEGLIGIAIGTATGQAIGAALLFSRFLALTKGKRVATAGQQA